MNTTKGESRDAVAGQVGRPVRPVAWWHKAENGGIRCWTSAHADALRLAGEIGFELAPLYDQAALDAAVAAERERILARCQGKTHEGCTYLARCGTVCNKCGQVA